MATIAKKKDNPVENEEGMLFLPQDKCLPRIHAQRDIMECDIELKKCREALERARRAKTKENVGLWIGIVSLVLGILVLPSGIGWIRDLGQQMVTLSITPTEVIPMDLLPMLWGMMTFITSICLLVLGVYGIYYFKFR